MPLSPKTPGFPESKAASCAAGGQLYHFCLRASRKAGFCGRTATGQQNGDTYAPPVRRKHQQPVNVIVIGPVPDEFIRMPRRSNDGDNSPEFPRS
jgi:hypothetical protein